MGLVFYPLLNLIFPGLSLNVVGRAMINAVRFGAPTKVLEAKDIGALGEQPPASPGASIHP